MKKFKYAVTYLTEDETKKTAIVEAVDTVMIPFSMTQSGIKDLKKVLSSRIMSENETLIVEKPVVEVEKNTASHIDDPHECEHGKKFLKFGKLNHRYVVNNKVFTLLKLTEGAATVQYHGKAVSELISRHTEVEDFAKDKHNKLLTQKETANV